MVIVPKEKTVTHISAAYGEWLHFPDTISAPSPDDRAELCTFAISATDTKKAARAGRRQVAFELWSAVIGSPPPVPGVGQRNRPEPGDLTSLQQAHACFRGIERPLAEDDDGQNVVAYITRPRFIYEYDPNMVSVASKVPVPRDVVFVTYVRLGAGRQNGLLFEGTITHWGFVEADPVSLRLPINYASRYRTQLW